MLISVVISTFQYVDSLAACLECIGRQTLSKDQFAVIVADGGGDPAASGSVRQKFPWVKWALGAGGGAAAIRNHGASLATGEWIVFVDEDCLPAPGWLKAIATQTDVDVIEGKTVCPGARDTPFQERVENLRGGVYWSCNLAVRRVVFERLGGFDGDFLETGCADMEFAWRIAENRLHTRFVAEALVEHPSRAITWKEIWLRTWQVRRMALFTKLKTGQSVPPARPWFTGHGFGGEARNRGFMLRGVTPL